MTRKLFLPVLVALLCVASTGMVRGEETVVELRFHKVVEKASDSTIEVEAAQKGDPPLHLEKQPLLTEADVKSATASVTTTSSIGEAVASPVISIKFTEEGTKKFAKVTKALIGHRLAILANNKLLTAPVIRDSIAGGSAEITGNFTREEAAKLVTGIQAAQRK